GGWSRAGEWPQTPSEPQDRQPRGVAAGRVHPARSGARVVGIIEQIAQRAYDLELWHHAPGGAGIDQAIAGSRYFARSGGVVRGEPSHTDVRADGTEAVPRHERNRRRRDIVERRAILVVAAAG